MFVFRDAIKDFFDFAQGWDTMSEPTPACADHLFDFVNSWLYHPDCMALIRTAGDYETYMYALTGIIESYRDNPSIMNYANPENRRNPSYVRQLAGVMDPACESLHCISPGLYKKLVFEWQVNEGVHM
ncbi:MAG: hypothetical protein ACRESJ_27055 [Pseudomonas sp.]|uniref:hypothetical protein n=1 Tax=Pseudomonas sp. TaxID=306 RepID=UPI003D6DB8BE